jgi:hypothetical protein
LRKERSCSHPKAAASPPKSTAIVPPLSWDGHAVKGSRDHIYLVKSGKLHLISSPATLKALKIDKKSVLVVRDQELEKYSKGKPISNASR